DVRVPRRLDFDPLEDRTMLAITVTPPTNVAQWQSLGPNAILGKNTGVAINVQDIPTAGAIAPFAVAASSAAPDASPVAFVAATNGGVWETNNLNATAPVDLNQLTQSLALVAPNVTTNKTEAKPDGGQAASRPYSYEITFVGPGGVEST